LEVQQIRHLIERGEMRPGEARLPWDLPDFSARMLAEHLNETHDLASRRPSAIEGHVAWLQSLIASGPGRVLDLGCGPGLYLERLASAGWEGVGVDISPAAIDYADAQARALELDCTYLLGDLRTVEVQGKFDLIVCLFGELSTFPLAEVSEVLDRAARLLCTGGLAVIEVSTRRGVRAKGERPPTWNRGYGGLFASGPHVVLREASWFADQHASVERWWVLDEPEGLEMLGSTTWWHGPGLTDVISTAGLSVTQVAGDLAGAPHDESLDFETFVLGLA
jgi:SAM-dependent methyltransferase